MIRLLPLVLLSYALLTISCRKEKYTEDRNTLRVSKAIQLYQFMPTDITDTVVLSIEYNSLGNPVKILFNRNEAGKPNYYLDYHPDGRLKQLITRYDTKIEYLYRFYYEPNSDLVSYDTMYHSMGDGTRYTNWIRNKYQYDAAGRITEVHLTPSRGAAFALKYAYNNKGNLILSQGLPVDPSTYDSKKSFISTHRVFQFLNRDYSNNNISRAVQYNSKGLPLQFPRILGINMNNSNAINFFNLMVTEVQYEDTY